MAFEEFGLHPDLLKAVHELGFTRPTPIQTLAVPVVLQGGDLVGCAQTGTGKTAAFGLPMLHRFHTTPERNGHLRALILAPTRELAQQVTDDFKELGKHTKVRVAPVYGGVGMGAQEQALRHGTEVIVATPGRLLDHMGRGHVKFSSLEILVLDEADRMLDMGFLPDMKRILAALPTARQTMLFSATFPAEIQTLANKFLTNPQRVQVDPKPMAATGITHAVYPVSQGMKDLLLLRVLRERAGTMPSVLVFTRTKHMADRLERLLVREQFKVGLLHGDRSQKEREQALEAFRQGHFQILVATDIAARGLDIEGISHVVNFDVPSSAEDYIHRVGRTARAEAEGDAFTLMDPEEERVIFAVEYVLGKPIPRITLPDFPYHVIAHPDVVFGRGAVPRPGAFRGRGPRRR